jgi:hypothetical protein
MYAAGLADFCQRVLTAAVKRGDFPGMRVTGADSVLFGKETSMRKYGFFALATSLVLIGASFAFASVRARNDHADGHHHHDGHAHAFSALLGRLREVAHHILHPHAHHHAHDHHAPVE